MGVPFLLLPSIRNFSVHASDNRGASWKRGRTGSSSKDLGVPGQRLENVSANILMSVLHPKSNIGNGDHTSVSHYLNKLFIYIAHKREDLAPQIESHSG